MEIRGQSYMERSIPYEPGSLSNTAVIKQKLVLKCLVDSDRVS